MVDIYGVIFFTLMFSPLAFCGKEKIWFFVWLSKSVISESLFVVTYLLKEFSGVYFLSLTFLGYTLSLVYVYLYMCVYIYLYICIYMTFL